MPKKLESLADVLAIYDPIGQVDPQPIETPVEEDVDIGQFCRSILSSKQYRESLLRRIVMDSLPQSIEAMIYHFGYGKPVEKVEHTGKDGQPIITEVRRVIVRASHVAGDDYDDSADDNITTH